MNIHQIRKKYLDLMKENKHYINLSDNLIPENDSTTLFTGSGMQSMINYLLGEKSPVGNRVSDSQKCFRSQDIDDVGDNRHTTFFEMLGNWSFGDYFQKEQIDFIWTFLFDKEKGLSLEKNKIHFTFYKGNPKYNLLKDKEVKKILLDKGVNKNQIHEFGDKKNWWSRAGVPKKMPIGEIGGPDCEIFYDFEADIKDEDKIFHKNADQNMKDKICNVNCDCGRFLEIGNSVFMTYKKVEENKFSELKNKNIDFGGGLERFAMVIKNENDIFNLEIFQEAKKILENLSNKKYLSKKNMTEKNMTDEKFLEKDIFNKDIKNFRVILDHLRAATFLIGDGVLPDSKEAGYVLRKITRRSIVKGYDLGIKENFCKDVCLSFIKYYDEAREFLGNNLEINKNKILLEIEKEENKFRKTLENGIKEFEKKVFNKSSTKHFNNQELISSDNFPSCFLSGKDLFNLWQSFGFPLEVSLELAQEKNIKIKNIEEFEEEKEKHSQLSKTSSAGMFKGGLEDNKEETTALHSATHLMLEGMRRILGDKIIQAGSNITSERVRFDFTFDRKLEDTEIKNIEDYVNQSIQKGFIVQIEEMSKEKAKQEKINGAFWEKYPEVVKVYNFIGKEENFSRELCGGPHIENTEDYLKNKTFKILKQEAVSAGVRRIKAVLI